MRGILKIAGLVSLLILVLNISIHGLIPLKTAVFILIFGIILQRVSDSLFRIGLTAASVKFFLWSVTGGNFSGTGQMVNGLLALLTMITGISIMFRGFSRSK